MPEIKSFIKELWAGNLIVVSLFFNRSIASKIFCMELRFCTFVYQGVWLRTYKWHASSYKCTQIYLISLLSPTWFHRIVPNHFRSFLHNLPWVLRLILVPATSQHIWHLYLASGAPPFIHAVCVRAAFAIVCSPAAHKLCVVLDAMMNSPIVFLLAVYNLDNLPLGSHMPLVDWFQGCYFRFLFGVSMWSNAMQINGIAGTSTLTHSGLLADKVRFWHVTR